MPLESEDARRWAELCAELGLVDESPNTNTAPAPETESSPPAESPQSASEAVSLSTAETPSQLGTATEVTAVGDSVIEPSASPGKSDASAASPTVAPQTSVDASSRVEVSQGGGFGVGVIAEADDGATSSADSSPSPSSASASASAAVAAFVPEAMPIPAEFIEDDLIAEEITDEEIAVVQSVPVTEIIESTTAEAIDAPHLVDTTKAVEEAEVAEEVGDDEAPVGEEIEDASQLAEAEEVTPASEPKKGRRRRRRRSRKKKDASATAEPASSSETDSNDESDLDAIEESESFPSLREYDDDNEADQEDSFVHWNFPTWQEIISSLYIPPDR